MRWCLVLTAALIVLVVAAPSAPARGPAVASKAKKKRCKHKTVPVALNGRRRCLPLKAALPRPRKADQRLLAAKAALDLDLGKLRDRRGRHSVSVGKLLKAKGVHTAEKAIEEGLGRLDRLQLRRSLSTLAPTPIATSSAKSCGGGPKGHPELTQSYKGDGFDAKVELDKGAAQIGVDLGAGGIRAEIELGLCDSGGSKFKVPECPDAEGTLKGSDESVVFFAIRIFKGAELLLEQSVDVSAETKIEPIQVDDDAKLEYFEIDHEYVTDAQLGGSTQAFGPIGLRVKYHGHTRVTFPGGSYDPSATDVEVKLNVAGAQADEAHELRDLEFDQELKAKKEADKNFAAEVDKAIGRITERESGWRQPNKCAEIKFEPATETLVLKRNQGGSLKARLDSRQGGSPQSAKWSLLGAQNAQINPGSALANPASFSYTVTNAGSGVLVRGTFKAVSRAGVAEGSWTQKTEEEAINHIAGTFGGEWTYETTAGPTKQEWTGTVVFDRFSPAVLGGASGSYNLTSGTVTVTASGIEQTSATACEQEGTKTFTYQGGGAAGSIYVGGSGQQQTAPYTYSLQTSGPPELMTIKRFNCPESAKKEGYEGSTGQIAPLYKFEVPEGHSPDGIEYAGSVEEDYGSTVVKQHWNLTGTP